jgi:hypothetical protein
MARQDDERGDEAFDWSVLVPRVVHPLKVVIVEALWWVDQPLSAADLTKLIGDGEIGLSRVSYHVVGLAKAGILRKVRERPVRGSVEKFYFFPPVSPSR